MNKVKINTSKKVSKETIDKHKNFNSFIKGYRSFHQYKATKSLYKKRRLFTLIIVIAILVLILLFDKLI